MSEKNKVSKRRPVNELSIACRQPTPHLLLSGELEVIKDVFSRLSARQSEHAELFGEAMQQSSETDRENAPAEAIQDEQGVVYRYAKEITSIIRRHQIVPFPHLVSTRVELGSRVSLMQDGHGPYEYDIVGFNSDDHPVRKVAPEDLEVISYEAPVARAVIGHVLGDQIDAQIGDRRQSIQIVGVDQAAVAEALVSWPPYPVIERREE